MVYVIINPKLITHTLNLLLHIVLTVSFHGDNFSSSSSVIFLLGCMFFCIEKEKYFMYLHSYAINIEQKVRGLIGNRIDRYALGGMIDSDYIEYGGMVVAICAGLVKYYGNGNNEKIDKFLEGISVIYINIQNKIMFYLCHRICCLTYNLYNIFVAFFNWSQKLIYTL